MTYPRPTARPFPRGSIGEQIQDTTHTVPCARCGVLRQSKDGQPATQARFCRDCIAVDSQLWNAWVRHDKDLDDYLLYQSEHAAEKAAQRRQRSRDAGPRQRSEAQRARRRELDRKRVRTDAQRERRRQTDRERRAKNSENAP